MAKLITLQDIRIKEIVIQPNSDVAMGITYELLDENDQVLAVKNTTIKRDALATGAKTAITAFATALLMKVKQAENF